MAWEVLRIGSGNIRVASVPQGVLQAIKQDAPPNYNSLKLCLIKMVRDLCPDLSLKEAKDFIEGNSTITVIRKDELAT